MGLLFQSDSAGLGRAAASLRLLRRARAVFVAGPRIARSPLRRERARAAIRRGPGVRAPLDCEELLAPVALAGCADAA